MYCIFGGTLLNATEVLMLQSIVLNTTSHIEIAIERSF